MTDKDPLDHCMESRKKIQLPNLFFVDEKRDWSLANGGEVHKAYKTVGKNEGRQSVFIRGSCSLCNNFLSLFKMSVPRRTLFYYTELIKSKYDPTNLHASTLLHKIYLLALRPFNFIYFTGKEIFEVA